MNVQIASDLHLELKWNEKYFEKNPLIPLADVLILAGDIMCFDSGFCFIEHPFGDRVSCDFKQTYVLLGNHEYYGGMSLKFIDSQLNRDCKNKVVVSHHVPLLQLLPER